MKCWARSHCHVGKIWWHMWMYRRSALLHTKGAKCLNSLLSPTIPRSLVSHSSMLGLRRDAHPILPVSNLRVSFVNGRRARPKGNPRHEEKLPKMVSERVGASWLDPIKTLVVEYCNAMQEGIHKAQWDCDPITSFQWMVCLNDIMFPSLPMNGIPPRIWGLQPKQTLQYFKNVNDIGPPINSR